ncbi:hypothetical protein LIPSTDRAFT_6817 [Lipomyces starkeyi NRRL Y-11557]|uniref:Uncharacterized protein n=1 Tax=Lipomyces starkeyi NRRL Y-11557 TaxID=675824 RepID=A0A1E3PWG6_LIPST|nr:hypothetical protein LIPSTDRAFT_6817 [Lipomyces starkeyi NRRL Y-11557]
MSSVSPTMVERQRRRIAHAVSDREGKSKTDTVLETLLQLRYDIGDLHQKLDSFALQLPRVQSPLVSSAHSPSVLSIASPGNPDFDAIIPPSHSFATEKLLSLEIFDGAEILRKRFVSTFVLESRLPPVPISPSI